MENTQTVSATMPAKVAKKVPEYTFDEMCFFEKVMTENNIDCKHFSPSSIEFVDKGLVNILIDDNGLHCDAMPAETILHPDDPCQGASPKMQQIFFAEPIESLMDSLRKLRDAGVIFTKENLEVE